MTMYSLFKILPVIALPLVLTVVPSGTTGCGPNTLNDIQTAYGPVSQTAVDGFACVAQVASLVTGPSDIAGIVAACSKFGVDAYTAYVTIKSLLNQAASADAGADASVSAQNPVLVKHYLTLIGSYKQ